VSPRRLFFALWPSAAEQQALADNFCDVVAASGGRAMAPSNLHLTLAFLGSVPEDALPLVRSIALKVSDVVRVAREPIEITFDAVEHWRKPQIICATASTTPPAAIALADALKRELTDAGFTPDLKAFRAHVTLARKVFRVEHLYALTMILTFRDFSLVESRTEPRGSAYSVIESWPLCAC
jgi:2'-5' RNA ligase